MVEPTAVIRSPSISTTEFVVTPPRPSTSFPNCSALIPEAPKSWPETHASASATLRLSRLRICFLHPYLRNPVAVHLQHRVTASSEFHGLAAFGNRAELH